MIKIFVQNFSELLKICGPSIQLDLRRWISFRNTGKLDTKILPKLVYIHNPLAYISTKIKFLKLRWKWDHDFRQKDFIRGTKQSSVIMTNIIRNQDGAAISNYTTPIGFRQISRDMILSQSDDRLKLVNFRVEDIQRAVPMKVIFAEGGGQKNCFIDMVFVNMRNSLDFPNSSERKTIQNTLKDLDRKLHVDPHVLTATYRILFAEIYMRFFRDYGLSNLEDWAVSFYKIVSFDILNYTPR